MTHCQVRGTGCGTVRYIVRWKALVVVAYDTLLVERHWSWYRMTHCHVKYTGHGNVWHNARWNTLVVVPYDTLPCEIHWSWYRIAHCQVKYTSCGTVWHIARWNTLVVVPYDILLGCTGRVTAWHIARWKALVVVPHDTLPVERHWLWYRMTQDETMVHKTLFRKTIGEIKCTRRLSSSCATSGTHYVYC